MPIQFVTGDLFANRVEAEALAHGCNCQGSMGAGIATGFRDRYPRMYEEYRRLCKAKPREFNLGDCWLWTNDSPAIFCLATQEGVWRARASYEAIDTSLRRMRQQADERGIRSIAIPRIGAGYGGLSWKKVRAIIEQVFGDWTGTLHVYETYVREDDAQNSSSIVVASRRMKKSTIERQYPEALIRDVTSRGEEPWVRFSPFYPHGGIPVPNSPGVVAQSVEGLWQGLKVFEHEDVDASRWEITSMRGIKRSAGKRGKVVGHRFGVDDTRLLDYRSARYLIYLPAYRWVLENRVSQELAQIRRDARLKTVILLDYETNGDIEALSRPLSHAALIKQYIEGAWPLSAI